MLTALRLHLWIDLLTLYAALRLGWLRWIYPHHYR